MRRIRWRIWAASAYGNSGRNSVYSSAMETPKRVLVVDDEPGIGHVLRIKLKMAGFDVITTTSGAEAIELVRTKKPDIVLLDILMPDVTGFDVLKSVRTFSSVPIVVFTARQEIVEIALKNGANDSVGKPFDPEQLVAKIKQLLSSSAP